MKTKGNIFILPIKIQPTHCWVGCRFQRTVDYGNKGQYFHFANQNTTNSLLLPTSQINIPNHLNNTQCPYYYPLSKNLNAKQVLDLFFL
jgi:hypothetical protein